jgi:hypothetical protein
LQIRELSCAFGLPRRLSEPVMHRWLGTPHVRFTLAHGAAFDGTACEVALPPEQALDLADRVLGGTGRSPLPGRAGLPTAAECGVLAYLAARCVRACGADLRVQDVTCGARALIGDPRALLWPLRITGAGDVRLDLKLIFADTAPWFHETVQARLMLSDQLDELALSALEAGDLLVSDGWSLYATASGFSGLLELCVAGSDERVTVSLEGDTLRVVPRAPPARKGLAAELLLAQLPLSFAELAGLMDGASLPCPALEHAALALGGRELTRGRLVRFQGQLALEVAAVASAREHERDHSTR